MLSGADDDAIDFQYVHFDGQDACDLNLDSIYSYMNGYSSDLPYAISVDREDTYRSISTFLHVRYASVACVRFESVYYSKWDLIVEDSNITSAIMDAMTVSYTIRNCQLNSSFIRHNSYWNNINKCNCCCNCIWCWNDICDYHY